jgi:predicted Zn finger-like uncharacterized protein
MRLICPNCGAQYEVDDSLIPAGGRDVQCSNCGHAWFQRPGHLDPELSEELGLEPEADEPEAAEAEAGETGHEEAPELPPRREMDPEVRSILSEEGERERQARRAEEPLETQGDLGLDASGEARGSGARERTARLRGLDSDDRAEGTAAAVAAATAAGSRRDLLPDIEEINSSLRPAGERADDLADAEVAAPRRRSGFGIGFMLVVLVAAIAVAVYVFADPIAKQVPSLAPAIEAYVALADRFRGWLDALVRGWVHKLSGDGQSG